MVLLAGGFPSGRTFSRPWTGSLGRRATGCARLMVFVGGGVAGAALDVAEVVRGGRGVDAAAWLLRPMSKGPRYHLLCQTPLSTGTGCQRQTATCRRRGVGDEGVGGGVLRAAARRCGRRRLPPAAASMAAKVGRSPLAKGRSQGSRLTTRRCSALTGRPGAGERAAAAAAGAVWVAGGVALVPEQSLVRRTA